MTSQNKFAIAIPTINRGVDLLYPSLCIYATKDFPNTQIFVLDNGQQGLKEKLSEFKNITLIEQESNIGVAASWNKMCKIIFEKFDYAFVLNDDIYLGHKEDAILNVIEKNKTGFVRAHLSWCAFIVSKKVFEAVGDFDENFYPAYFEDNDYTYRMKLKGIFAENSIKIIPLVIRESSSIKKDPLLNKNNLKNKNYYIQKWGGLPEREKFKKPFNK